jgi:hypothetical protein
MVNGEENGNSNLITVNKLHRVTLRKHGVSQRKPLWISVKFYVGFSNKKSG